MTKYRHSVEELSQAVKESSSIRQVLMKLGIVAAGGNYATLKKRINDLGIDMSHFTGKIWNKGKTFPWKTRKIEEYLSNRYFINSHKLRLRLIREKILKKKCCNCHLETWLDKEIPLELHHIDGDNTNNNLYNLQLLCPNCHALTYNYRGKNKNKK